MFHEIRDDEAKISKQFSILTTHELDLSTHMMPMRVVRNPD